MRIRRHLHRRLWSLDVSMRGEGGPSSDIDGLGLVEGDWNCSRGRGCYRVLLEGSVARRKGAARSLFCDGDVISSVHLLIRSDSVQSQQLNNMNNEEVRDTKSFSELSPEYKQMLTPPNRLAVSNLHSPPCCCDEPSSSLLFEFDDESPVLLPSSPPIRNADSSRRFSSRRESCGEDMACGAASSFSAMVD